MNPFVPTCVCQTQAVYQLTSMYYFEVALINHKKRQQNFASLCQINYGLIRYISQSSD